MNKESQVLPNNDVASIPSSTEDVPAKEDEIKVRKDLVARNMLELQRLDEYSKKLEVELEEMQNSCTDLENHINSLSCRSCFLPVS